MMPRRRGYHLAPYTDAHGDQYDAADVLTSEEIAERRWGVPPRREDITRDPALVGLVARLQRGAS